MMTVTRYRTSEKYCPSTDSWGIDRWSDTKPADWESMAAYARDNGSAYRLDAVVTTIDSGRLWSDTRPIVTVYPNSGAFDRVAVGDRVMLTPFERFQHATESVATMGTVSEIHERAGLDRVVWVKLDRYYDGLDEWDNCLHVSRLESTDIMRIMGK